MKKYFENLLSIFPLLLRYLLLSSKSHDMRKFKKIEIFCPCDKLLFSNYSYSVSAVLTLLLFFTQNLIKKCAPLAWSAHCKISKFLLSTNIYQSFSDNCYEWNLITYLRPSRQLYDKVKLKKLIFPRILSLDLITMLKLNKVIRSKKYFERRNTRELDHSLLETIRFKLFKSRVSASKSDVYLLIYRVFRAIRSNHSNDRKPKFYKNKFTI